VLEETMPSEELRHSKEEPQAEETEPVEMRLSTEGPEPVLPLEEQSPQLLEPPEQLGPEELLR